MTQPKDITDMQISPTKNNSVNDMIHPTDDTACELTLPELPVRPPRRKRSISTGFQNMETSHTSLPEAQSDA